MVVYPHIFVGCPPSLQLSMHLLSEILLAYVNVNVIVCLKTAVSSV